MMRSSSRGASGIATLPDKKSRLNFDMLFYLHIILVINEICVARSFFYYYHRTLLFELSKFYNGSKKPSLYVERNAPH